MIISSTNDIRHRQFITTKIMNYSKLLFCFLLFICSHSINAQTLVVWQTDNSKAYFNMEDEPKTTFEETDLVITTKTNVVRYPLSKILRYTFEGESLGIKEVKEGGVLLSQHKDDITVTGLPKSGIVNVYSTDGKLLLSKHSDGSDRITISLSSLPSGLYIIKAGSINYKYMKL